MFCLPYLVAPLFIPEDPCPRTGPWSARTGPRTGSSGMESAPNGATDQGPYSQSQRPE